ncbi:pyridoxine 5'-phosphate synthase [Sulfuriroseicoccus oceanibius]|uniref:Pyridoxine 5'-phosphate synthase n=1 Tax=Sulfuriroseicoccus oceanibius TaxID=2707525 RepID=A0A7T7F442_9BACT|nr:pyridoxine 5'-phosphate synthase [Sulfuriroseicoccus oceanibius]
MKLGVNIDHVATLRQARYATMLDNHNAEPNVVMAAFAAVEGGADSITMHPRADGRHVQLSDVEAVRAEVDVPLNMEMGNTPEMVEAALRIKPDYVCLVPETREELTTEGGLDVVTHAAALRESLPKLQAAGIEVSLFIDPVDEHVRMAAELGAEMIELHTGAFANHLGEEREAELERLKAAAELGHSLGLQVNAGHGINYQNLEDLFAVPHLAELNIGHTLVSRSVFVGLVEAVREMREGMDAYPTGGNA